MLKWISKLWKKEIQAVIRQEDMVDYADMRRKMKTYSKNQLVKICLGLMNQLSIQKAVNEAKAKPAPKKNPETVKMPEPVQAA